MKRRSPSPRRQPPASLHADLQPVHDGITWIGTVARCGTAWRGLARGGLLLGEYSTAIEARRAVLTPPPRDRPGALVTRLRSDTALEAAIVDASCRVLARRAARLRSEAGQAETTTVDGRGRIVPITSPEGTVKRGTAELFDQIAADLREDRP